MKYSGAYVYFTWILENLEGFTKTKILISKDNKRYTEEMDEIREYIINNNGLPDKCNVLITTSCMRDGINILADKTRIENVVCYDVSTATVMQFVGRYR